MRRQRGFGTLIIYAVLALAILGTLAGIAWKIRQSGYQEAKLECTQAAAKQRELEAQRAAKAATDLEAANAKRKVVYRTITKTVDRIVGEMGAAPCLTPDGVRAVNDTIRGEVSAPAVTPRTVRGVITVAGRIGGDDAQVGGGDSAGLPGDMRPAQEPDGRGEIAIAE